MQTGRVLVKYESSDPHGTLFSSRQRVSQSQGENTRPCNTSWSLTCEAAEVANQGVHTRKRKGRPPIKATRTDGAGQGGRRLGWLSTTPEGAGLTSPFRMMNTRVRKKRGKQKPRLQFACGRGRGLQGSPASVQSVEGW